MAVPINSIKFWIKAFIPKHVPGFTLWVPNSSFSLTMIPGPARIMLGSPPALPVNPALKNFAGPSTLPFHPHFGPTDPLLGTIANLSRKASCYYTDQRDFSNDIGASARMHSEARVQFNSASADKDFTVSQYHHCGKTTDCECSTGKVGFQAEASTSTMSISALFNAFNSNRKKLWLNVNCSAYHPDRLPYNLAPMIAGDIDYSGFIIIDRDERSIECHLNIDSFPAFEAYATINDGYGIKLFQAKPPAGKTVMDLPGYASRLIKVKLEDADGDGIFEKHTSIQSIPECL